MIKKLIVFGVFFLQLLLVSAQNGKKLTFIITDLPLLNVASSTFYLAGNFNNWNPKNEIFKFETNKQSQPQLTLLLTVSTINFKVTKGSWDQVECSSNGKNLNNRSLKLVNDTTIYLKIAAFSDQFKHLALQSTATENVKMLDSVFYIPQLGVSRRIWIYIPPSYQNEKKKFPVIYMHDGQNLFDKLTSGFGEWGVDEILDSLSKLDIKQSIVVGINHGGSERLLEYNPFDSKFGKGKGDAYVDFIVKSLKPFIDKNYRTLKSAKHTSIIGSSMGGLLSLYAAVKYPKTFGATGVFSPAFWISPLLYDYASKTRTNKKTRFYFLAGELESKEMVSDMQKMHDLLVKKGYPLSNLKFITKQDGQHSEWFWQREFPDFYKWLVSN